MLILVKHATPVLDGTCPPREWVLGREGEAQARELAGPLMRFRPTDIVSSREPKALRTAELLGAGLRLPARIVDGLEEIDRPASPIAAPEEHARHNRALFDEPSRAVVGEESADDALLRFGAAITTLGGDGTCVAVTHGTVISLFVAAHNPDVDAFDLWRRLATGSFVVLSRPGYELVEPVGAAP